MKKKIIKLRHVIYCKNVFITQLTDKQELCYRVDINNIFTINVCDIQDKFRTMQHYNYYELYII